VISFQSFCSQNNNTKFRVLAVLGWQSPTRVPTKPATNQDLVLPASAVNLTVIAQQSNGHLRLTMWSSLNKTGTREFHHAHS